LPLIAHHRHRSALYAVISVLIEQEIIQVIKKSVSFGREWGLWEVVIAPFKVQRAAHDVFAANKDEDAAVLAVPHRSGFFAQIEAPTADDGGELRIPGQRYKAQALRVAGVNVEAEEAGRVPRAQARRNAGSEAHRSQRLETAAARTRDVGRPSRRRIS
jgi:hypothetical protein